MEDNKPRCGWARGEEMRRYHDTLWGVPTTDEALLYEFLLLEAFQAGLSWALILKKRENFRRAFDGFDPVKIAAYGEEKIQSLLGDAGIIRSRGKIRGAIQNARCFLEIQREFGSFARYLYSFTGGRTVTNTTDQFPTATALSDAMAKDLKKRGMAYMGSVTLYSYLQAVGVVNDHETGCFCYQQPLEIML